MCAAVVSGLKALDTSRSSGSGDDIFPFIPIFASRCWKPLAFDGQQGLKVVAAAPINPDGGGTRRGYEVNLSVIALLIRFFYSKLKKVPAE